MLSKLKFSDKIFVILTVVIVVGVSIYAIFGGVTTEIQVSAEMVGDNYYVFTEEIYQREGQESRAVLLNFHADWCGSCAVMEPVLVDLFSELAVRENISAFRVGFGDSSEVPEGRELAAQYGVYTQSSIVILNSDGEIFRSFIAPVDREVLRQALLAATLS